jgi:hypothetical protein
MDRYADTTAYRSLLLVKAMPPASNIHVCHPSSILLGLPGGQPAKRESEYAVEPAEYDLRIRSQARASSASVHVPADCVMQNIGSRKTSSGNVLSAFPVLSPRCELRHRKDSLLSVELRCTRTLWRDTAISRSVLLDSPLQTRTLGAVSEMRFGGVHASVGKRILIEDLHTAIFHRNTLFTLAFAETLL